VLLVVVNTEGWRETEVKGVSSTAETRTEYLLKRRRDIDAV